MEHLAREPDDSTTSIKLRPDTVSHFTKAGDLVMEMMNHMTTVEESPMPNLNSFEGSTPFNYANDGLDNFALGQMGFW